VGERQHHHHCAHALQVQQALQVFAGQVGCKPRHQRRGGGGQHPVKGFRHPIGQTDFQPALCPRLDVLDGGIQAQVHAALPQGRRKAVGKCLEAAAEGAQAGGARLETRPEPRHVDILVVPAKFANQQRLELGGVEPLAVVFAHPRVGGHLFQRLPARQVAQPGGDKAKAGNIRQGEAGKGQCGKRRIERVEGVLVIDHRLGAGEEDFVLPAQLADQPQHGGIRGEPVVVELLHRPIPMRLLEPCRQPAHVIRAFQHGHLVPGVDEIVGGSQPAEPCSNDANPHSYSLCGDSGLPAWGSSRRMSWTSLPQRSGWRR